MPSGRDSPIPWAPEKGLRCNPAKLLLDPYAKAIKGQVQWDEAVYPYHFEDPDAVNDRVTAPFVPKSVVIDPGFDWEDDRHLLSFKGTDNAAYYRLMPDDSRYYRSPQKYCNMKASWNGRQLSSLT